MHKCNINSKQLLVFLNGAYNKCIMDLNNPYIPIFCYCNEMPCCDAIMVLQVLCTYNSTLIVQLRTTPSDLLQLSFTDCNRAFSKVSSSLKRHNSHAVKRHLKQHLPRPSDLMQHSSFWPSSSVFHSPASIQLSTTPGKSTSTHFQPGHVKRKVYNSSYQH